MSSVTTNGHEWTRMMRTEAERSDRPDGISDTEGKSVAGNREQAPKRASLTIPDSPRLLRLPTEASAKVGVFCGDRPLVVPDSRPFASIRGPHFYIRKLRGEVLENL
jgi:hypothetical protein